MWEVQNGAKDGGGKRNGGLAGLGGPCWTLIFVVVGGAVTSQAN